MVARADDGPDSEAGPDAPRRPDRPSLEESLAEALRAVAAGDEAVPTRTAPVFPAAETTEPVPRPPRGIPANLRLLAPPAPVVEEIPVAAPEPAPEPIRLVLPPLPVAPPAREAARITVAAWKPEDDDILPLNRSRRRLGR